MHLGDLPFELQLKVAKLCSRQDLASLARTHKSLRDVADYALYSHIRTCSFSDNYMLLRRLPVILLQKASLVKVLEFQSVKEKELEIIAEMLPNMPNLYKLLISVWKSGDSGRINQAIRFVFIQTAMFSGYDY